MSRPALDTHGLDYNVVQFAIAGIVRIYSVNGYKGPQYKTKLSDSYGPLVSKVRKLGSLRNDCDGNSNANGKKE